MKNIIASLLAVDPLIQLQAQREYLATPEDLTIFHNHQNLRGSER